MSSTELLIWGGPQKSIATLTVSMCTTAIMPLETSSLVTKQMVIAPDTAKQLPERLSC